MPKKTVSDENSNVIQKLNGRSLRTTDNIMTKKILLGNSQDPSQERVFAREIKNFTGTARQNSATTADDLEFVVIDLLNQFTVDSGTLCLDSMGTIQEIAIVQGRGLLPSEDAGFQSSVPQTHASGLSSSCLQSKQVGSSGYDSENASSTYSSMTFRRSRRHRFSIASKYTNRPSFRSASIASQSTPLPMQGYLRASRPIYQIDDQLRSQSQFFGNFVLKGEDEQGLACESQKKAGTIYSSATGEHDSDALMTQLTTQLSELELSPYKPVVVNEVPDDSEIAPRILSRKSTGRRTRIPGRASSFSLGFIPEAFPEEIDIKDLRVGH